MLAQCIETASNRVKQGHFEAGGKKRLLLTLQVLASHLIDSARELCPSQVEASFGTVEVPRLRQHKLALLPGEKQSVKLLSWVKLTSVKCSGHLFKMVD